jgi:predicted DCC family thiol-disulfide oxidoreductase YuxK
METPAPLVLFDGVCNVCDGFANFVIDRDPAAVFRFASLQSEAGQAALLAHGRAVPSGDPETIVLIEDGRVYERSSAVLRIVRRLKGPWRLLYLLVAVPPAVRDMVYGWVARHRYGWFGRRDSCRVPTPALRARFLDEPHFRRGARSNGEGER